MRRVTYLLGQTDVPVHRGVRGEPLGSFHSGQDGQWYTRGELLARSDGLRGGKELESALTPVTWRSHDAVFQLRPCVSLYRIE